MQNVNDGKQDKTCHYGATYSFHMSYLNNQVITFFCPASSLKVVIFKKKTWQTASFALHHVSVYVCVVNA